MIKEGHILRRHSAHRIGTDQEDSKVDVRIALIFKLTILGIVHAALGMMSCTSYTSDSAVNYAVYANWYSPILIAKAVLQNTGHHKIQKLTWIVLAVEFRYTNRPKKEIDGQSEELIHNTALWLDWEIPRFFASQFWIHKASLSTCPWILPKFSIISVLLLHSQSQYVPL